MLSIPRSCTECSPRAREIQGNEHRFLENLCSVYATDTCTAWVRALRRHFTPDGINAILRAEEERRRANDSQKKREASQLIERIKAQGVLILQLRKAKGWSRMKLASHSGVAYETLMRIEKGMRSWEMSQGNAVKLADALGISIDELVREDPLQSELAVAGAGV